MKKEDLKMSRREVKSEKTKTRNKPWGGRFQEGTDARVEAFTESVSFDYRLAPYDITASIAHAEMLGAQGIITKADARKIVSGLKTILTEVEANEFEFHADLEDVHMNVEAALTKRIGAAGGRLHTARSRNDQVATSLRLWLRNRVDEVQEALLTLRRALLVQAEAHVDTVMRVTPTCNARSPFPWRIIYSHTPRCCGATGSGLAKCAPA